MGSIPLSIEVLSNRNIGPKEKLVHALATEWLKDGPLTADLVLRISHYSGMKVNGVPSALMQLRKYGFWHGAVVIEGGASARRSIDPNKKPQRNKKHRAAPPLEPGKKPTTAQKLELAEKMRQNPTHSERTMARILAELYPGAFTSQVVMHGYIADFYSKRNKLVIEVDGSSHDGREEHDRTRDKVFAAHGVRTLRFTNHEIKTLKGRLIVKQAVDAYLQQRKEVAA